MISRDTTTPILSQPTYFIDFQKFILKRLQDKNKRYIFAVTVSTTPLKNAYQGGTFAFYTLMNYTKQPLDYLQIE